MQHSTIISNYPDLVPTTNKTVEIDDVKPPPPTSNYPDLYLTSPDSSLCDEEEMPLLDDYPEPPTDPYPFSQKKEKEEEPSCLTTMIIALIGCGLTLIYGLSLICPYFSFW